MVSYRQTVGFLTTNCGFVAERQEGWGSLFDDTVFIHNGGLLGKNVDLIIHAAAQVHNF